MRKNKFITSAFTLLVAGFITKILGMVIRVVYTRCIGEYGMSLYNLVMPTFSLVSSIALFALPLSISRLVSSSKYNSKTIGVSALFIAVITNLIFITGVILLSKPISIYLLHEPLVYGLLICSLVTIPFISISSILKGYFFGKQKMFPTSLSNVIEQIV
ncbi:MAG: oligosaccharide flippase family protein, partial [Bacilli bacterium]